MDASLRIRQWAKEDALGVRNVLKQSWTKAYSAFIPQNDLDFYLDKTYSESALKDLSEKKNVICYVAQKDNLICGWLKLTIDENENRFYLSSIYVLPEFQKMKIGDEFFKIASSTALEKGFSEIYIGVMIQNIPALKWYEKLGFNFFEEQPFTMGSTSVTHLIGKKNF